MTFGSFIFTEPTRFNLYVTYDSFVPFISYYELKCVSLCHSNCVVLNRTSKHVVGSKKIKCVLYYVTYLEIVLMMK